LNGKKKKGLKEEPRGHTGMRVARIKTGGIKAIRDAPHNHVYSSVEKNLKTIFSGHTPSSTPPPSKVESKRKEKKSVTS